MGGVCRWCGVFIKGDHELFNHQELHRQLDDLAGYLNNNMTNTMHSIELEQTAMEDSQHQNNETNTTHSIDLQEQMDIDESQQVPPKDFNCDHCCKSFTRRDSLLRHKRSCYDADRPNNAAFTQVCSKCSKKFARNDAKMRHEKSCRGTLQHVCPRCNKLCNTAHGLRRHLQWHEKAPLNRKTSTPPPAAAAATTTTIPTPPSSSTTKKTRKGTPNSKMDKKSSHFRCRRCTETFDNRHDLYLHGMRQHYQSGGALQSRPWRDHDAPWQLENGNVNEDFREVYEANARHILQPHHTGPILSVYNFPVDNTISLQQLMAYAENVYDRQQRAFRLNIVFGVILQNRQTNQFRYFIPFNNNGIFERPLYISRRQDLQRLRLQLQNKDILTELLRQRPDTKWIPVLVTNVHFTVYKTFYPLGQGQLPQYLLTKDSLDPLVKNLKTGQVYKDNLCAFRCLALHRGHDIKCLEGPAHGFHTDWTNHTDQAYVGLSFEDFPEFETFFKVNLEVYSLEEDGFARSIYKSMGLQETTMYLNLYENHLSYIKDFNMYAKKYQCKTCDRHFDHAGHLHRHQKICTNRTKYIYPGGFYKSRDSIFEELDHYGIHVPQGQRTFDWFLCYDLEAILQKVNDQPTEMLHWTQKHVPISVSICSNIPNHTEPVCIVDADQDSLVVTMVETMTSIADSVYELAEEKWDWVLEAIDRKIDSEKEVERSDSDDNETDDTSSDQEKEEKEKFHPLKTLYGQLLGYMRQVPVLGFNSSKYDLNLIKQNLAKHLNMHGKQRGTFVVKKCNAYTCIANADLKFLDMSQYLAAGSSYAGFLKAYGVPEQKGYFPYEWFDDVNKLDYTSLPAYDNFYSTLKGSNISPEDYQYCQQMWSEHKMTTFRDFLVWYNNLDVGPFVKAVENFQKYYFDRGIDVFKTAISVPGIARQQLFQTAKARNVNFALFDRNSIDLYQTVKNNIVGGPSIIFTRHHRANKTKIRGGEKTCQSILGFDANALYLQSIGKPMPIGPYILRRAENDFRPDVRDKYMAAYYWMNWISSTLNVNIQHKLNSGSEVRIGKYPVDGYLPAPTPTEKPTVFQFNGCYWHGHICHLTKAIKDKKWLDSREDKFKNTRESTAYIRSQGCEVVEMWECEFKSFCRQNPQIYHFIDGQRPGFFQHHKGKIGEDQILEGVVNNDLFGMVEVDIQVPDEWPRNMCRPPSMTPYDYFKEMSPLFCTTDIPYESIGKRMQEHVETYNLSKNPRRLLVGGMKAQQILLATPLLQWYIHHGLMVTKIYQVIEYQQDRCFQEFVKEVSDARREGDVNPETAIIAETSKVKGNSAYGSLIMDKSKHKNISYVQGENEVCLQVNDPTFRKLECLDGKEQYYELEMAKRCIKLDLPIQLGYFVLQYAKLRMLEFYYDFMDVYVDRSDFEYCEMDTDSAYMAISGSSLDEVIKPDMRETYHQGLQGFCSDTEIEADSGFHWFPRTCCEKHAKFDKRTPGLFKLEYQGDELIGLCSKTYIVRKTKIVKPSNARLVAFHLLNRAKRLKRRTFRQRPRTIHEHKFSSKGVSKRNLKAPMSKFRRVLSTGIPQSGLNRGFRVRNNAIFTYTQERKGFSYFYCKRRILDDGIHTVPLDVTLCPMPQSDNISDQEVIDALVDLLDENNDDDNI